MAQPWTAPDVNLPLSARRRNQGWWVLLAVPVAGVALVFALHALGVGVKHNDAPSAATYSVKADFCTWRAAAGTVQNLSDKMSDVSVWVNFVDSDGTQLASGLGSVYNLAPGATARWSAPPAGEVSGNFTCRVAKVSQFPSR